MMAAALADTDFAFVAREVKARSGLVLTAEKSYLLETRLAPIARKESLASVAELAAAARLRRDERLIWQITDALTTSETQFFRDKAPFALLRDHVIPHLQQAEPQRRLRIWCAATSTGQEAFSLAMMLDDLRAEGRGVDAEIIATDISERLLEKARAGLFTQFEVQRGLPIRTLIRHFEKVGDLWRIADRIRAMVRFQRFNLLDDLRPLGMFDIVLCRNVLCYFAPEQQRDTLERIAAQMRDEGALVLGAGESTVGVSDAFAPEGGFYRRLDPRRAAARVA
ncbi:MAG: protein-glutamate O-methyltransferase CheR [Hyphomonadaceae bacterium]|nr:protein-glutamate O-methyltransferase CheR [Hyphomonadaceae bacterium]